MDTGYPRHQRSLGERGWAKPGLCRPRSTVKSGLVGGVLHPGAGRVFAITPSIYAVEGIVPPPTGWRFLGPPPKRTTTKFHHARYTIYCPTVIVDQGKLTLFDAGTPESFPQFKASIEGLGFKLSDIKNIVISHAHADHVGELKRLVDVSGAEVYAHEAEAPYVEKQILGRRDFEAAKVDVHLRDGDTLDILGGVQVIHIPGHTPGHIALYSGKERVLLAADLLRCSRGEFHLCPPQYSVDYAAIARSMVKVAQYDFDILVPYHGEPLIGKAQERYSEFVEYLKAISDIFRPSVREALAPEIEG